MDLAAVLLTADAGLVLLAAYFTVASFREKEPRAPWVGAIVTVLLAGGGLPGESGLGLFPPRRDFLRQLG